MLPEMFNKEKIRTDILTKPLTNCSIPRKLDAIHSPHHIFKGHVKMNGIDVSSLIDREDDDLDTQLRSQLS